MISSQQQEAVDAAITSRRSIRAFLDQAVAREDVEKILEVAARAQQAMEGLLPLLQQPPALCPTL